MSVARQPGAGRADGTDSHRSLLSDAQRSPGTAAQHAKRRVVEDLPDTLYIGYLLFEVRESYNRSTIGITVDRDGSLLLHAPVGDAADAVAAWAYSKRMWVYRKLAEKDLLLSGRPVKEFVTGEGFSYLGRSYRLLLADCDAVRLERGRLMMPRHEVGSGDPATAPIRWYRTRGQEWLLRRMKPWARRS